MKFSITLLAVLATFAMASPKVVGEMEVRQFDCSTCGCSSSDACTFDVSLHLVLGVSNCWQDTNMDKCNSAANKRTIRTIRDYRDGLKGRGSFSSLYGVLDQSLSSADEKRVPIVID
ncbi:uncharacterized protein LY89DRAFT_674947 [Mollisia scopiformis]|uniref:Uncharacterized protein n=1 Tax=Mollisia scopiformis TaxID=149040 RepID=A0A194WS88_MOLSC|nr:uncharacterized protein LY89DRAFT_674947 [Mollisia scopiformis]KUJ10835.1 hypothetical protein LY89DRAFT_674947 [Mollisia scopiformis]